MITFSINTTYSTQLCADAWGLMDDLTPYFRCFYYNDLDNAKHRVLEIVLKNYNSEKGDLKRYIMATAKKMRLSKSKEIAVDTTDMENPMYNLEELQKNNKIIMGNTPIPSVVFCDMNQIEDTLRDIYLINEDAFKLLYDTLVESHDLQKGVKINHKEIKTLFLNCVRDAGIDAVTVALNNIYKELCITDSADNKEGLVIPVKEPTKTYKNKLKLHGVIQTIHRENIVMNEDTLLLNYPIDSKKWMRVNKSSNHIYRIPYCSIIDDIYMKAFSGYHRNTEYIVWCGNRYKCFTLSGKEYLNIDEYEYFDKVRNELVSSILRVMSGSVIGCTPDNIYIQVSKRLSADYIDFENYIGTTYRCEICLEKV